ncbi:MAG: hypothetical protein C4320_08390, partial [Armatimonadota bacterium]
MTRSQLFLLVSGGLLTAGLSMPRGAQGQKVAQKNVAPPTFERNVEPVISKFCSGCHGGKEPSGGVSLP